MVSAVRFTATIVVNPWVRGSDAQEAEFLTSVERTELTWSCSVKVLENLGTAVGTPSETLYFIVYLQRHIRIRLFD